MKALTVKQPWASLIVEGIKDIENRTWPTKFRGRILIHAGVTKTSGSITDYINHEQNWAFREKFWYSGLDFLEPLGAIIGSVEIVDCVQNHPSIWAEQGKYNWVLANPIKFTQPIPAKGKLSLWEFHGIDTDENRY